MRPQPYLRCPACDLIGPPENLSYELGNMGQLDWEQPVYWQCAVCGFWLRATVDQVLSDDAVHVCTECAVGTPCPQAAARVECRACGLVGLGPAAIDPQVAGQLLAVEGLYAIQVKVRRALENGHAGDDGPDQVMP
jgi:rubredoxin